MQPGSQSPPEGLTPGDSTTSPTTSKCVGCSTETGKNRKFNNIGMNTELSLTPDSELDLSKMPIDSLQNSTTETPDTNIEKALKGEHTTSKLPSPTSVTSSTTTGILKAKQSGRDMEACTIANGRSPPSPIYSADAYNGHRKSQARYPTFVEPSAGHYDRFVQSHAWLVDKQARYERRSPHHHRDRLSPSSRRSPLHQQRSRSPLSPRTAESRNADYPLHYHGFYDKYRPVLLPTYPHGRVRRGDERIHYPLEDDKREVTTAYLRQEPLRDHPQAVAEFHQQPFHDKMHRSQVQPGDEPPVFVLPNDYDIISGIDPRVASIQDRRSVKYPSSPPPQQAMIEKDRDEKMASNKLDQKQQLEKERLQHQPDIKEEYQQKSPEQAEPTNGGDSPDSSTTSTNNSQKLYCKICSGVFPTKSLLYKHLRGHTSDEKPFKCNECGQGFTLSSNLRQHRIIHRGYKPFQCEFCGKKFMRSNVYKQHRRIHTGEEMHKCGLCPSEFLQKYALLKHMKKNHDIDAVDN